MFYMAITHETLCITNMKYKYHLIILNTPFLFEYFHGGSIFSSGRCRAGPGSGRRGSCCGDFSFSCPSLSYLGLGVRKVLLIIPTVKVPQLSTVQAKEDCAKWIGLPYQVAAIFFYQNKDTTDLAIW